MAVRGDTKNLDYSSHSKAHVFMVRLAGFQKLGARFGKLPPVAKRFIRSPLAASPVTTGFGVYSRP